MDKNLEKMQDWKKLLDEIEKDKDIQDVNHRFDIALLSLIALVLIIFLTIFIISI
jgi:hypothetical protein